MPTTPLVSVETAVGTLRALTVPSPNCPQVFEPQHCAAAPTTAHVEFSLALIAVTPLDNVVTATAVTRWVTLSSPSWPFELKPQHFTAPLERRAHACCNPLATEVTPLVNPKTFAGVFVGFVVALEPI
jgi:hypothetical protein